MCKKLVLQNGLRLLTIPMQAAQTFTVLVMVATGSRYESKENSGISHFLEHMFFKGTKKRPTTLAISTELDKIGGEFNAFTGKEYTGYYAKVDGAHAQTAIDVISDMLLNSKFDAREIIREKGVILSEMNMYQNNPIIHIDDLFEEVLYGDTPLGWDTIGTEKNIKNFKRKDFLNYINSQYQSKDIVVSIAGNFTSQDVKFTKKIFQNIPFGKCNEANKVDIKQTKPQLKIKNQKVEQISISIGTRAYDYNHRDYLTVKLLGIILGGSMSSRLFISVRERRGLAYQVHANSEGYMDNGYLTTVIGTSIANSLEAIKIILSEYRKIAKFQVGSNELKKAKDFIRGKTVINLESSDDIAAWYAKQEILNFKEVLTPSKFFQKINAITAHDLKRVAGDIFRKENLNIAVIGKGVNEKEIINILNRF